MQTDDLAAQMVREMRDAGWMVAVHNDYRLGGALHTFWLFTKGSECVKGEGTSDAKALAQIKRELEIRAERAGKDGR